MEVKSRLYHTLMAVLSQVGAWLDVRHQKTLCWMVMGLLESEEIGLTRWLPYAEVRAKMAQSVQRRFVRWLENERIEVNHLNVLARYTWPWLMHAKPRNAGMS